VANTDGAAEDLSELHGGASVAVRLLRIALPLTMAGAVRYAVELSAIYWMGRIGVAAIAVVASLSYFLSLLRMLAGFTSAGTSAVIGRLLGEGRRPEAIQIGQRVVTWAPALGIGVAAIALPCIGMVLSAAGIATNVRHAAAIYLAVLLVGIPFAYGLLALNATLVGLGHARWSFVVNVISLLVAFGMTPILVLGLRMGLPGAAIAQVTGDACALTYGVFRLRKIVGPTAWLPLQKRLSRLRSLIPVLKVGTPLTLDAVFHGTIGFALIAYLARYGSEYVAAQGTEERLTQILNLPSEGLAPATATLVGFYVGRNDRPAARRTIGIALALMAGFALGGALLLMMAPRPIIAFLCDDPGYIGAGVRFLGVAAVALIFLGARDLMDSSFGGLGNTLPPLIVGIAITVARFPLAILLSRHLRFGGMGVAWAINGTLIAQAIVLLVWLFLRFDHYADKAGQDDHHANLGEAPS
jgi:putative MATE family efflux protein